MRMGSSPFARTRKSPAEMAGLLRAWAKGLTAFNPPLLRSCPQGLLKGLRPLKLPLVGLRPPNSFESVLAGLLRAWAKDEVRVM